MRYFDGVLEAIEPSDQTVNATYYSQVNHGLRRDRNVVINQRQIGPCGMYRQCIYNDYSNKKKVHCSDLHVAPGDFFEVTIAPVGSLCRNT